MLKAVIEQENVDGLLRLESVPDIEAILADTKDNTTLQPGLHQIDFITGAIQASIAPAEDRDAFSLGQKLLGEPNYDWSFARTAHSEIANADYSPLKAPLPQPTPLIHPDTRSGDHAI